MLDCSLVTVWGPPGSLVVVAGKLLSPELSLLHGPHLVHVPPVEHHIAPGVGQHVLQHGQLPPQLGLQCQLQIIKSSLLLRGNIKSLTMTASSLLSYAYPRYHDSTVCGGINRC